MISTKLSKFGNFRYIFRIHDTCSTIQRHFPEDQIIRIILDILKKKLYEKEKFFICDNKN